MTLQLERVPKMLGELRQEWAPNAFVVSFKLETDNAILLDKVGGGLAVVVGCGMGWGGGRCCELRSRLARSSSCFLWAAARPQARGAVRSYGVHLVVANELHSRKNRVWLVAGSAEATATSGDVASGSGSRSTAETGGGEADVCRIDRPEGEPVIERPLVAEVVAAHRRHMAEAATAAAAAARAGWAPVH